MKVDSKYKNPDKFIEGLQRQLKWANEIARKNWDMWVKGKGELIVSWNPVENIQSCGNNHKLGTLKPGDIIAIIGHVTEVSVKTDPSCNNESSKYTYTLKETRRIGRWY